MGLTRGWRSAAAAAGAALLVCACGSERADDRGVSQAATDATVTAQADGVSVFGVSISGGGITFSEDRRVISAATLLLGDRTGEAGMTPPGFDDDNEPPESFDISADEQMQFGGNVIPSCPAEGAEPLALDVTSTTGDGSSRHDRLPLDVEYFDKFAQMFCDGGIQAASYNGGLDAAHGAAWVRYTLLNPGPGPVTVTSEESSLSSGLHWHSASVELPAGEQKVLMIRADGPVHCGSASPSALELMHASDGSVVKDGQETIC